MATDSDDGSADWVLDRNGDPKVASAEMNCYGGTPVHGNEISGGSPKLTFDVLKKYGDAARPRTAAIDKVAMMPPW
eukprot:gene4077-50957_t